MNVAIVIVLSSIFNLLSCAKLDRNRNRVATPTPITSTEFLNASTGTINSLCVLLMFINIQKQKIKNSKRKVNLSDVLYSRLSSNEFGHFLYIIEFTFLH